jgi:hypothetical protein
MHKLQASIPIAVLVATRIVVLAIAIDVARSKPVEDSDILRFQEIGDARGIPWRNHEVEYMPGETLVILGIVGPDAADTAVRVAIAAFVCDVLVAVILGVGFGRGAAVAYLVLGLPLLLLAYLRLDLLPVLMTAGAFVLLRRGRDLLSGLGFGLAVLTKVWPVVLVPIALVEGRLRAVWTTIAAGAVGGIAWLAWGGPDAPIQVATFRHAAGWGLESPIGVLVWIVTGGPTTLEQGAPRVGAIPDLVRPLLFLVVVSTIIAVWLRSRRWPARREGAPALAAICGLLVWSPLFSLQYATWLLVPTAIAWGERESRGGCYLAAGAIALTGGLFVSVGGDTLSSGAAQVALLVRNALVVGVLVWWFVVTARGRLSAPIPPRLADASPGSRSSPAR